MKLRALITAFTTSRTAGLIFGCVAAGVLAGVVTALVTIRQEPRNYEAWMQLFIGRPAELAQTSPEEEWLESCAAHLRQPDALARAARSAGMDNRPVTQSIAVQVTGAGEDSGSRKVISLTCRGEDAQECAALLDRLAGVMGAHLSRLNLQREAAQPGRQRWLELTAQLPELRKEISTREREVRDALNGLNARRVNLSPEELLHINPPLIAKVSHDALKAATEKFAEVSREAARLQPSGGYSLRKTGGSAPADALSPLWEPYAWPRALTGGGAGLLLGLALALRKRPDQFSAPMQTHPHMKPVEY